MIKPKIFVTRNVPDGIHRIKVTAYDSLGRPYSMNDGSANVISSVTYGVANELLSISGIYNESRSYNSRLQLTGLNGVTFTYRLKEMNPVFAGNCPWTFSSVRLNYLCPIFPLLLDRNPLQLAAPRRFRITRRLRGGARMA